MRANDSKHNLLYYSPCNCSWHPPPSPPSKFYASPKYSGRPPEVLAMGHTGHYGRSESTLLLSPHLSSTEQPKQTSSPLLIVYVMQSTQSKQVLPSTLRTLRYSTVMYVAPSSIRIKSQRLTSNGSNTLYSKVPWILHIPFAWTSPTPSQDSPTACQAVCATLDDQVGGLASAWRRDEA